MNPHVKHAAAFVLLAAVVLFAAPRPAAAQTVYYPTARCQYAQPYVPSYTNPVPGAVSARRYVVPRGYYAPRTRRVRRYRSGGMVQPYNWPTGRNVPMYKPWLY
jgi:hypothetical protein